MVRVHSWISKARTGDARCAARGSGCSRTLARRRGGIKPQARPCRAAARSQRGWIGWDRALAMERSKRSVQCRSPGLAAERLRRRADGAGLALQSSRARRLGRGLPDLALNAG
ncbi:hypothetical protein LA76x_3418 [Lysobacter antibioticus]|uniref:Uncharacterized protein n=1 Tax=Lysobacter antibioticus TaxID=84531 RepID=A0A0S2FD99_LYSAN|nr:hypothetical protein LA76x_3418 [Lysobacter antibioticus]